MFVCVVACACASTIFVKPCCFPCSLFSFSLVWRQHHEVGLPLQFLHKDAKALLVFAKDRLNKLYNPKQNKPEEAMIPKKSGGLVE